MTEKIPKLSTAGGAASGLPAKITWDAISDLWNRESEKDGEVKLAKIGHKSEQRCIALARVKRLDKVTKSFLKSYFKKIRKGGLRGDFPKDFPGFRPTIDWALKKSRVSLHIQARANRKPAQVTLGAPQLLS